MKKTVLLITLTLLLGSFASARDWYISAKRGSGREGTVQAPAKDMGNVVDLLAAGDRVFIAEGSYLGRGENGSDEITVPVEIYGGWSDDFSERDPWGKYKTILTGSRTTQNFAITPRLSINTSRFSPNTRPVAHKVVVEGLIFDHGPRNTYTDDKELRIKRKAAAGSLFSPDTGALVITTGQQGEIVVQANIVMNAAASQGAFAFFPGRGGKVLVKNNAAINNTGFGFHLSRSFNSTNAAEQPAYTFENNMAAFTEKYDPFSQTQGGSAIKLEANVKYTLTNNIFALSDFYGIDNAANAKGIVLRDNLFFGNVVADYLEFNTKMKVGALADEARGLADAKGNLAQQANLKVSQRWASAYMARNVIDRNIAEAKVSAPNTGANQLRSILGLNVQGGSLGVDSEVWLPRMSLEDAMSVIGRYGDKFGPFIPAPSKR
jgi:hypothetical protein